MSIQYSVYWQYCLICHDYNPRLLLWIIQIMSNKNIRSNFLWSALDFQCFGYNTSRPLFNILYTYLKYQAETLSANEAETSSKQAQNSWKAPTPFFESSSRNVSVRFWGSLFSTISFSSAAVIISLLNSLGISLLTSRSRTKEALCRARSLETPSLPAILKLFQQHLKITKRYKTRVPQSGHSPRNIWEKVTLIDKMTENP